MTDYFHHADGSLKSREELAAEHRERIATRHYLTGHTSPETAYMVDDYPYGFRLRCQIRYWLEYKPAHGFRLVSQTSNPKKPGIVWNKPKPSVYSECLVMILDEDGHVAVDAIRSGGWTEDATVDAFETHYADALTDAHRSAIRFIRASNIANRVTSWTVKPDDGTPRQTIDEQLAVARQALAYGYSQLPADQ